MKRFMIDRLEKIWAVVELEGETVEIPKAFIPSDAKEGDVFKIVNLGEKLTIEKDEEEKRRREEKIKELQKKLLKRSGES